MRRATQKQRFEFIHLFMKHAGLMAGHTEGDLQRAATRLLRYGATLGRIAEMDCNSPDYPSFMWKLPEAERLAAFKRVDQRWQKELDRNEAKEARIREKVTILCERFNCKPVFQGDPRGNTLKIQVPDGYTNDWGREGICVPTS